MGLGGSGERKMVLCSKPCRYCPMTVTVLIQGRHDCAELTDMTREVMHDHEDDSDIAILFRIGSHDVMSQCFHSRQDQSSYDSCLF